MEPRPYRSTPVFTEKTLPPALRREHKLKPGTWGRLEVLSGAVRFVDVAAAAEQLLNCGESWVIPPDRPHYVEPLGQIEMRIDFYHAPLDDEAPAA